MSCWNQDGLSKGCDRDDDMEDNDDDGINEGNVDDDAGCALLCKLCGHLMSDLKTREDKTQWMGSQEMYVCEW